MDSILFKLVINYYYLWNEAPKFFEKLIFKQKTSWRGPHTSLPRRCYLTAEDNVCAESSAAEIRVLDPQRTQKINRSANFPFNLIGKLTMAFLTGQSWPVITVKPGQAYPPRFQIPNLKFLATITTVVILCRLHEWIKLNSMCDLSGQTAVFDRFVSRLKFCPTRPLLSEKMSHRKFTDHTRLKVERRLSKHKRIWETKALLSSKNATLTIGKVWYALGVVNFRFFSAFLHT